MHSLVIWHTLGSAVYCMLLFLDQELWYTNLLLLLLLVVVCYYMYASLPTCMHAAAENTLWYPIFSSVPNDSSISMISTACVSTYVGEHWFHMLMTV